MCHKKAEKVNDAKKKQLVEHFVTNQDQWLSVSNIIGYKRQFLRSKDAKCLPVCKKKKNQLHLQIVEQFQSKALLRI